jgi:hypothetical protein
MRKLHMEQRLDPLTKYLLNKIGEDVTELKQATRTTVTRQTKVRKAAGQLASSEARKRHDPLYKRMIKHRELYYKYRQIIHKKYGSRVRSRAKR